MTEEPTTGTVVGDTGGRGLDARTGEPDWEHEEYHGRPVSWVAVTLTALIVASSRLRIRTAR